MSPLRALQSKQHALTRPAQSPPVHPLRFCILDTDADLLPDEIDTDDDGDGTLDKEDAFPLDDRKTRIPMVMDEATIRALQKLQMK